MDVAVDSAKFKLEELGELSQLRWGIEEGYKMYKARVQVEAFSGKTASIVIILQVPHPRPIVIPRKG
jgi:IS4 transposase